MAAVLPALLPTPPRSQMLPLLPTPCLVILPANFAPPSSGPGRADAADRWDASKKKPSSIPAPSSSRSLGGANSVEGRDAIKKPYSPVSSSSGSSSGNPGRADAVDRWDTNKKPSSPVSSSSGSGGSPDSADAVDRWDANKKLSTSPASSWGGSNSGISGRWDAIKLSSPVSSCGSNGSPGRADAVDRWDANKKLSTSSVSSSSSSNKIKNPGGTSVSSSKRQRVSSRCPGRASSTERRDIHYEPDVEVEIDRDAQTEIDEKTKALAVAMKETASPLGVWPVFCVENLFASPEPSMLPMPTLLLKR